MKRICALTICIVLALTSLTGCGSRRYYGGGGGGGGGYSPSFGEEPAPSFPNQRAKRYRPDGAPANYCGNSVTWAYDSETGVLTLEGVGDMWDFRVGTDENDMFVTEAPWFNAEDIGNMDISKIVISEGITHIGDNAFRSGIHNRYEVVIPSTLISIGDYAFEGTSITGIALNPGFEYIGAHAFENCSELGAIALPDTLKIIGDYAFGGCLKLTSFVIGKSVEYIGNGAFAFADAINNMTVHHENPNFIIVDGILYDTDRSMAIRADDDLIGDSCTIIDGTKILGDCLLYGLGLRNVTLPQTLSEIGNNVFCENRLSSISLPEGLRKIGETPFQKCGYSGSLVIPASVNEIAANALYGVSAFEVAAENAVYSALDNVLFDKGMTEIIACSSKKDEYRIPDGVVTLGEGSFVYADIGKLTIPATVKNIKGAFDGNGFDKLVYEGNFDGFYELGEKITADEYEFNGTYADDGVLRGTVEGQPLVRWSIRNGVYTAYGYGQVFGTDDEEFVRNATGVTEIVIGEGITAVKRGAFDNIRSVTSIRLPESLELIDEYVFEYCEVLRSIYIPKNVENIGDGGNLEGIHCRSLQRIDVDPENKGFRGVDGVLYDKEMTTLVTYPQMKGGASYVVPQSVEYLSDGAFFGCAYPGHVDLSMSSVKDIGNYTFNGCTSLTSIKLGTDTERIGKGAFGMCSALKQITLEEGLRYIDERAFSGSGLEEIRLPSTLEDAASDIFDDCTALAKVYYNGTPDMWERLDITVGNAEVIYLPLMEQ